MGWSQAGPSASVQGGAQITVAKSPFPCDHHDTDKHNLLRFIDQFETDFPECKTDWKLCVTKMRKLTQYNDDKWDHMIVDRKDVQPPGPPQNAPYVALLGPEHELNAEIPPGPNGEKICDWKHILTGIDAFNFPKVDFWWRVKLDIANFTTLDGPAACTWAGDVGSALAEYDVLRQQLWEADPPSLPADGKKLEYYQKFASDDDMMGDIDGLAAAISGQGDEPFSRRLCRYYCGMGSSPAPVKKRFHLACQAQGIQVSNNEVTKDSRKFIQDQIETFAIAWAKGKHDTLSAVRSDDRDWYVDHFVFWLEQGLRSDVA